MGLPCKAGHSRTWWSVCPSRVFKSRWQSKTCMRLLPAQPERPPMGALLVLSFQPFIHGTAQGLTASPPRVFPPWPASLPRTRSIIAPCSQVSYFWAQLWQASLVAQTVESAYNSGELGSILGSGRSLGEGNGNPLQYSCLENPMDGGAWQVAKSQTRLSGFSFSLSFTLTESCPQPVTTSPRNCLLQLTPENGFLSVLLTLCERISRGWRAGGHRPALVDACC